MEGWTAMHPDHGLLQGSWPSFSADLFSPDNLLNGSAVLLVKEKVLNSTGGSCSCEQCSQSIFINEQISSLTFAEEG